MVDIGDVIHDPSPSELNVYVLWARLLDLFRVECPCLVLPAKVQCPLCRAFQLEILTDTQEGGQWGYCEHCGFAGDMIELAAAVWSLSVSSTVHKLHRLGFDLPVDRLPAYLSQHVNARRRLRRFWNQSQEDLLYHSTTLRSLLHELGLSCDVSPDRWKTGPGRLFGGAKYQTMEALFMAKSMKHARGEKYNASHGRIFKGKDWDEVLVAPYYDLPGRIAGLLAIGRDGCRERDFVFKRCLSSVKRGYEAGVCFHPQVRQQVREWNHTVFAMDDALTVLRLQAQQFERSLLPLPLVAWRRAEPGTKEAATQNWQIFHGNRIVFWAPGHPVAAYHQAIAADGLLSTVGPRTPTEQSVQTYIEQYSPEGFLQQLARTAKIWPIAAALRLSVLEDADAENLLLQLDLSPSRQDRLMRHCELPLRKRLKGLLKNPPSLRQTTLGCRVILEHEASWWRMTNARPRVTELIVDAVLRIEQIIRHSQSDRTFYRGRILYRDMEIPFCEPQDRVERKTLDWMRTRVMDATSKIIKTRPRWSAWIVPIAMEFHPPSVIKGIENVGWNADKLAFVLPKCTIGVDGTTINSEAAMDLPLPGGSLKIPRNVRTLVWQDPAAPRISDVAWATAVAVLANVLSPIFQEAPAGIALAGDIANTTGSAVAKSCGCLDYDLRQPDCRRHLQEDEVKHSWPLLVYATGSMSHVTFANWYDGYDGRAFNCVVSAGLWTALSLQMTPGWLILAQDETDGRCGMEVFKRLIPGYLRDLCRRRLTISRQQTWFETVHEDFFAFLRRLQPACVLPATLDHVVTVAGTPAAMRAAIFKILKSLVEQSRLQTKGQESSLFVPHVPLAQFFAKRKLRFPTLARLSALFDEAGILQERRAAGWVLDWPGVTAAIAASQPVRSLPAKKQVVISSESRAISTRA